MNRKLEMMLSIGADHVLDYQKDDFTEIGESYDVIVDTVARRKIAEYKRILNPEGLFVMIGGSRSAIFQAVFLGRVIQEKMESIWGSTCGANRTTRRIWVSSRSCLTREQSNLL